MNLYSQSVGAMRFQVIERRCPMGSEPNLYMLVRHASAPQVIGLRYLGHNEEHANRQFLRARDNALAALAAEAE
jgi:hypothetical protein